MKKFFILISQLFFDEETKMKNIERVSCPKCTMFTWAHDLVKGASGVLVCGGCARISVRHAYKTEQSKSGLRLVYSELEACPPVMTERRVA